MANLRCGLFARYFKVISSWPSRSMRCTTMRALNTMVHVESRNRFCNARKTSATPASPECVAIRICSMYLDLGAASLKGVNEILQACGIQLCTLILVAPLTDFSHPEDIFDGVRMEKRAARTKEKSRLLSEDCGRRVRGVWVQMRRL